MNEAIKKLAQEIIDHLNDLEGFDDWWGGLGEGGQKDTTREIEGIIEDSVDYLKRKGTTDDR